VETAEPEDKAIISIFRADAQDMPLTVQHAGAPSAGQPGFHPAARQPFLIVVAPVGDAPASAWSEPRQRQAGR
jgi:ureidoglycolate lyase